MHNKNVAQAVAQVQRLSLYQWDQYNFSPVMQDKGPKYFIQLGISA